MATKIQSLQGFSAAPSGVCARHLDCRVVGICDDIFIIVRLSKALSCAAEMKKILKADLDRDLNVPKFNVFFPDTSFTLDTARSALDSAVRVDPALLILPLWGQGFQRMACVLQEFRLV